MGGSKPWFKGLLNAVKINLKKWHQFIGMVLCKIIGIEEPYHLATLKS